MDRRLASPVFDDPCTPRIHLKLQLFSGESRVLLEIRGAGTFTTGLEEVADSELKDQRVLSAIGLPI